MLWQMLILTLLLNFSSTCKDELLPMFGECKKHLQWGAERARYPVPRLDWFRSLWVDVAPMDFIWGSSFRSVQRSLFDPKKMTWRFITRIYKYLYITCITTQVHSPQWWEVCHIRQITIFGQEPWLRAPQPHRIHEEMLWWPGLSKGKLVGHPEGQSQQNSPMSAIAIEFECYSQYILIYVYMQIILLILISCWSLFFPSYSALRPEWLNETEPGIADKEGGSLGVKGWAKRWHGSIYG